MITKQPVLNVAHIKVALNEGVTKALLDLRDMHKDTQAVKWRERRFLSDPCHSIRWVEHGMLQLLREVTGHAR